jgi:hypothetical protein
LLSQLVGVGCWWWCFSLLRLPCRLLRTSYEGLMKCWWWCFKMSLFRFWGALEVLHDTVRWTEGVECTIEMCWMRSECVEKAWNVLNSLNKLEMCHWTVLNGVEQCWTALHDIIQHLVQHSHFAQLIES